MNNLPTLELEARLLREGIEYIAGVDEAGRGPVAGPVTAAAVVLPIAELVERMRSICSAFPPPSRSGSTNTDYAIHSVRDSKKLSASQRESIAAAIKEIALDFSTAHVPHDIIDSINILNATRLAVIQAIGKLKLQPKVILIDGKFLNIKERNCISIVKGDSLVYSIAAASIIAKTTRDAVMLDLAGEFPHYKFDRNKGYLTQEHLQAIREHGYSRVHRKSFSIIL